MKRVLVTGASGFIGRHTLDTLLDRGFEVVAVTSKRQHGTPNNVRWFCGDLLQPQCAAEIMAEVRPTHLLHCAWYAVPGKYGSAPENFHWVQASLRLLEAFARCGGVRVVSAGTCAEYDWNYGYCVEHVTPLNPDTLYGISKGACQALQAAFCRQFEVSGAWGRIFHIYGPHEHPDRLVASVTRSLLAGNRARCTHGRQMRDLMHVQDVADAMVALLDSEAEGPVNIASGVPVPLRDVVGRIADYLAAVERVDFGALPSPASDPPMIAADVRRLWNEVGWTPHYTLETGLEQTIEWWYEHTSPSSAQAA